MMIQEQLDPAAQDCVLTAGAIQIRRSLSGVVRSSAAKKISFSFPGEDSCGSPIDTVQPIKRKRAAIHATLAANSLSRIDTVNTRRLLTDAAGPNKLSLRVG